MPKSEFRTFEELIERAWKDPTADVELRRRYETNAAIMVVDFTGMVHRSDSEGIIYALSLARAAERAMNPAIDAHQGKIVKRVADTFFAVFAEPGAALDAALEGQRLLAAFNDSRTGTFHDGQRNEPIHGCIGLGWGPTLVLPGEDIYGPEVNRAFVLGEDTGDAGEILASAAFWKAIGTPPPGIGAHTAPEARRQQAGFDFRIVVDHRD